MLVLQNKSSIHVQSPQSWFHYGGSPEFAEVLCVCLLRQRSLGFLLIAVRGAAAAVWGGPAVSPAVGLAQRQISAVPLTAALQSRTQ